MSSSSDQEPRIPSPTKEARRITSVTGTSDEPLDAALVSALRDNRERVALLRLEDAVVQFVKSDASWIEVGGPLNSCIVYPNTTPNVPSNLLRPTSFHRCLVHRLADRFSIARENGTVLLCSIRLMKLPDTRIPERLLQDFQPSEYGGQNSVGLEDPLASALMNSCTIQPPSKPRKMKIMKRSEKMLPTNALAKEKKKPQRRSPSLRHSDKEKAYAEARARIFSEDSITSEGDGKGENSPHDSGKNSPVQDQGSRSNTANSFGSSYSSVSSPTSRQDSGLENKAVYRNRAEESSDPDFKRGLAAVGMVPMRWPAASAGAPTYNGGVAPAWTGTVVSAPQLYSTYTATSELQPAMPFVQPVPESSYSSQLTATSPSYYPRGWQSPKGEEAR